MHLTSIIFAGLLILQIVVTNMLFSQYTADYHNKFEEKRLQIAVNYAVDGATKEMKRNSANLDQDYESIAKLNVDPMVALDTFSTIMCKNYEIPVNTTNQQSIMLDYCPVFMVATYDGFYTTSRQKINSSGIENVIFSPKLPYIDVHTNKDGTKSIFSYNLTLTSALRFDENGAVYKDYNPPKTRKEQSDIINNTISDVLNEQLLEYAGKDPRGELYIPSEVTTLRSTNPIRNTTVLAYIDNFDMAGYGMDLQSFGIGGAEIKQRKVVVGFSMETNGKTEYFYSYSDRIPVGATPIESFDSQESAAQHGYYYYIY